MFCNFTPTKIYDFPINKFFFLKNPTYQEFENKLKKILLMNEKKYFNLLGKRASYIIEDVNKVDANDEINSYLDSILKSDKIKKIN